MLRNYWFHSCSKHNSHCCGALGFVIEGREREKKKHNAWPWLNISTMSVPVVYSASLCNKNRAQERMRWESGPVCFSFYYHDKTSVLFRKSVRATRAEAQTLLLLCLIALIHFTVIKYVYSLRSQKVGEILSLWPYWLKKLKHPTGFFSKRADKSHEDPLFNTKKDTVEVDVLFQRVIVLGCSGKNKHPKISRMTKITLEEETDLLKDSSPKHVKTKEHGSRKSYLQQVKTLHFVPQRMRPNWTFVSGDVVLEAACLLSHHVWREDKDSLVFPTRPLWVIQQIWVVLPEVPQIIPWISTTTTTTKKM